MKDKNDTIQPYERVFNIIGMLGFALLLPVGLGLFGITGLQNFLAQQFGPYGDPAFYTVVAFILIATRIIFGSGYIIMPLILGLFSGFLLAATYVNFGFMGWYRSVIEVIPFMHNYPLNFLTSVGVLFLGILLSYLRRLSGFLQITFLVIVPFSFLAVAHYTGFGV